MDTLGSHLQLCRRSTLNELAADPSSARRDYRAIAIDLPDLDRHESDTWERVLNRPLRSTGTGAAIATMLLTTVLWVGYSWLEGHTLAGISFSGALRGDSGR